MDPGLLLSDTSPHGSSVAGGLRIVVADQDPSLCQSYRAFLARLGHQACEAGTGRQLIEQCGLLRPDLVITAVQFPDLDGGTAAEEICRIQPTPIILVPGDHEDGAVGRALYNQYVLACVFKPVKEADLGAAITVARRRFEQIESLRKEAADLRQALEDRKLIERAKGLVTRYAGLDEQEAFRRLQKLASDRNRKLVEVAQDILAAGEVFQQIEQAGEVKQVGDGQARGWKARAHRNGSPTGSAERQAHHAG